MIVVPVAIVYYNALVTTVRMEDNIPRNNILQVQTQ